MLSYVCEVDILYIKNNNRFYVGMRANIQQRIKDNNLGRNKSTKAYRPWTIVHKEDFQNRTDARKRKKILENSSWHKIEKA